VSVPVQAWGLMLHEAEVVDVGRRAYLPLLTNALKSYWKDVLPKGACKVLEWLAARTAGVGTPAAVGTLKELLQPYTAAMGVVVHPLEVSINTLRTHLQLLGSKKLVKVYEIDGDNTTKQNAPRAFEIDFKVVVLHPGCTEAARRKVLLLGSTAGKGSLFGVPPPKMMAYVRERACGNTYINRYEVPSYGIQRLGKPNLFLSASPIGGCRGDLSVFAVEESELKSISLATPKKPRVALQRSDSVKDILAGLKAKTEARAATTKAKAAAGATDKATMQNYLNELMKDFYPLQPRLVVTDKPLGVMRKRLASYGIADYRDLLRFAIAEWASIAKKNRMGFTRKIMSGAKVTPMAEYPSFAELAYRLPYFITIFNSGAYTPAEDEQSSETERLRKKVDALQKEVEGAKNRLRQVTRRVRPETAPPPAAPRQRTSDDWVPPSWE
jgi:hypothetical protein